MGKKCVGCIRRFWRVPERSGYEGLDREGLLGELARLTNVCRMQELIFEHSADTLFATDGEGVIIKMNHAYELLSDTTREELLEKNVRDLVGHVMSESCTVAAMEAGKSITLEQRHLRTGRTSFVTSKPIYDDSGALVMVLSNNRDFDEIEELRVKLASEREKNQRYQEEMALIKEQILDTREMVARDKRMLDVLYRARRVALVDSSVLITGETGTGKEELAKYIHQSGSRKNGPFIRVNCGAITSSLIESEFFGYERGAFTGASPGGKKGFFEIADHGTIFLDEIGELPLDMQVKLLRVLQEQEITRVGGNTPVNIDMRILAATNRDLKQMMGEKRFREDLYYRLSVVVLELPALRDRPDDIVPLTVHFLDQLNEKYHMKKILTRGAYQLLKTYPWPGNVRELKNILEEAVVMAEGDRITREDFSICREEEPFQPEAGITLERIMDETEYRYLTQALDKCRSIRKAAGYLGLPPSTYARRLKALEQKLNG